VDIMGTKTTGSRRVQSEPLIIEIKETLEISRSNLRMEIFTCCGTAVFMKYE